MMKTVKLPTGFVCPWQLAGLPADTPVAVAFSGGADSVALLHMLKAVAKAPITAIHVHHGIRGEEADRDAAFCRDFAKAQGVAFALVHVDVPALAAKSGRGLETVAREARYQAIAGEISARDIPLLVTAHHADDQLETMLQNLLRGAGLRGLCGIPARRELGDATVARPLLQIPKATLLQYCADNALPFVTDSSNLQPCCARNRVRLEVLPVLAELWPAGSERAAQAAALIAEDEAYLAGLAADFLQKEGDAPTVAALAALPRPILVRVLQQLLPKPPEAVHIAALHALLQKAQPHASLSLPGCRVGIEGGRLHVYAEQPPEIAAYHIPLSDKQTPLPNGLAVLCALGDPPPSVPDGSYAYAARIDFCAAAATGTLHLRPRKRGERILHGGMHKAVRKLPCMAGFSPDQRARLPLLCDDGGVLAIPFGPVRDGAAKPKDTSLYLFFN